MNLTPDKTPSSQPEAENNARRSGCLSAFLIAMFIINPLAGLYYIINMQQIASLHPGAPLILFIVLAGFSFVNLGLAIATWKWLKIGVYGFWMSALIILVINLYIGVPYWTALLGMTGPLLITLLVRSRWADFK